MNSIYSLWDSLDKKHGKGIFRRSRQRHFHFFQKVWVKNLMQAAGTVAPGPAAITPRRTPKPQNLKI